MVKFQTFDQQIADRFTEERMVARLTTLFGVLALLLATIGLYGVTAYTAASRTAEIGIRMALGAARTGVTAMVMRGAMIQIFLGFSDRHAHRPALCSLYRVTTFRDERYRCRCPADGNNHVVVCCVPRGGHSGTARRVNRSCTGIANRIGEA